MNEYGWPDRHIGATARALVARGPSSWQAANGHRLTNPADVDSLLSSGLLGQDALCAPRVEQEVLGAILRDPSVIPRIVTLLSPESFYKLAHRTTFAACVSLWARGHPPDLLTAVDELKRLGVLDEVGGATYLAGLYDRVLSTTHVEAHARVLVDRAAARDLQASAVRLAQRAATGEDIATLNEELAQMVRAVARLRARTTNVLLDGEGTAEELLTTDFPKELAWVEKLAYPGGLGFIVGAPGIGKTTFAFQLAVALALGEPLFGLETRQCNVGLLILETPGPYAKRKLEALLRDPHPPEWAKRIFLRGPGFPSRCPSRWDLTNAAARAQIIEWIAVKQLQVVVLDPFIHLHNLDENDTGEMNRVMAAFDDIKDQTGVSLLPIHHPGKGESTKGQRGRGSSVFYGYADVEVTMTAESGGRIKFEWTKPPRNDPAPPPFYLVMTADGILERAEPQREATKNEHADETAPALQALHALGGRAKFGQISNELAHQGLGVTAPTLTRRLRQLEARRLVSRPTRGTYEAIGVVPPPEIVEYARNGISERTATQDVNTDSRLDSSIPRISVVPNSVPSSPLKGGGGMERNGTPELRG